MANPIYDIAAISTNTSGAPAVVYGTVTTSASSGNANSSSAQIFNVLHSVITSAGWTQVTSTVSNTRTNAEYHGLQSPWYDPDAVPSWYTANIPYLRINAAASASNISFTSGQWNGSAGTNTSTGVINLTTGGNFLGINTVMNMIANPYQFVIIGTRSAGNRHGFLMSALHIPDFVQERVQVKNAMVATNDFVDSFQVDNGTHWTFYESNLSGGAQAWTGDPNNQLRILVQGGGANRTVTPSKFYIWNPTDTAIASSSNGWPLLSPPIVAWKPGTGTPATTDTSYCIGMFWDALLINRSYTVLTTATGLPEAPSSERRNWIVFGTSGGIQASLMFITGLT